MGTNILLVDDNMDLLKITQLILKSKGFNCATASTIEAAENCIRTYKPVLLLLDVCLCDGNGLHFCSSLKNEATTRNMRIIMMSGNEYGKEEWNGADDFLCKPFDFNTLIEKVEAQLRLAAATVDVIHS